MYNPVVDPSKKHYGSNFWDCFSSKINRDVHFYSELEYDHWIHIETNLNVIDFCEKPRKIKGILDNKIHETTFDMWVKWKDGKEEFLEVAYRKAIETSNRTKRRIQLQSEWCKNNNCNYRTIDETQIRKQPFLDNLKVMLPYARNFDKINEILIFSLLKNISHKPISFHELLSKIIQVDTNSFYLNIFYLYYQGDINLDVEESHFNHLSKVWIKDE